MALKPARLQWSDDGSLESLDYGDVYFQRGAGLEESRYVFLEGNGLPSRFKAAEGAFCIAELGFGSGLNFLLTADLFDREAPASARLVYVAIEKHPIAQADLAKVYAHFDLPQAQDLLRQYPPMIEGFHCLSFLGGRIRLMLLFGDVTEALPQVTGSFDAWYLDGFSPVKNPDMWNEALFPLIGARSRPGGTLATFSVAGHMRRGLKAEGFSVEKKKGYGVKWSMTVARRDGAAPDKPRSKRIAVLGAGIAGCAAAHALMRRGHSVTLVDRHGIAAETSGNAAGILYPKLTVDPSPMGRFHSHAFCFARRLAAELKLPSWRECGVLHLDLDAADAERTRELLARNEYPEDFAAVTEYAERSALLQPSGGMLSPPEFCAALAKGAEQRFGHAAASLVWAEGEWEVRDAEGGVIAMADDVVVAGGYDSKSFAQTGWLPLQSLRGQMTALKPTAESAALDKVICHDGYITPAIDGLHYIGATFQKESPGDASVRAEDDAENLEKLNRWLPQFKLSSAQIAGSRAGYRATTPDKLPMIGPAPDYEACRENFAGLRTGKQVTTETPPMIGGLYISTGFGAHGLSGAPLGGDIIAAMISDEPLPVPQDVMEHLMPERFIFRGLKRKTI